MAKWSISTEPDGRRAVRYFNLIEGKVFECGLNRADTPISMLVDWCAIHGDPGDFVIIEGGPVLLIQDQAEA